MKQYLDLVQNVFDHGVWKENRTGVRTLSNFAEFYKVDLSKGYPLLTTKKVFFRSAIIEMLWYLRGEDHIKWLRDRSEEHTSELQSRGQLVCRLLLEKKK